MDFRSLDLNLLLVLDAMFRLRNTTHVARELAVSQPTVSLSIKKLRDFFGDELFVRNAFGMQPTQRMTELAEPVARMVSLLRDEIMAPAGFDPASSGRRFVINVADVGELAVVPGLMSKLRDYAPNASVETVTLRPDDLQHALNERKVDLAIGYLPELGSAGIMVQSLFDHPFVCLVREGHPTIRDKLTLELYRDASHIALVGEGHSQKYFEAMIRKAGIERRIVFQSLYMTNVPFVVRDSDLVATVPRAIPFVFQELKGLRTIRPPVELPKIPIKQYWHRNMQNDAGHRWLRQTIGDMLIDADPTWNIPIENPDISSRAGTHAR